MKNVLKTITIATALVCSSSSFAGSSSGPITGLIVNTAARVFFTAGTVSGAPGCATALNSWALDTTTTEGKSMYASLLTARALGQEVSVVGLNNCNAHPDREKVQFIVIAD